MSQLIQLTKPPSPVFIETKPKAGRDLAYVSHANVSQLLLAAVGPYSWSKVPDSDLFDKEGNLEAAIWKLEITVDGKEIAIESVGDYDGMKGQTQGFRAQVIEANSFRRAAAKAGCCLELWVDGGHKTGEYVIHDYLSKPTENEEKK